MKKENSITFKFDFEEVEEYEIFKMVINQKFYSSMMSYENESGYFVKIDFADVNERILAVDTYENLKEIISPRLKSGEIISTTEGYQELITLPTSLY